MCQAWPMERGRLATVVVVDDRGSIRGVSRPRSIELPWWQECGPLIDRFPGLTVLRLLDVEPTDAGPMGGHTIYLAEPGVGAEPGFWVDAGDDDAAAEFEPWPGRLTPRLVRRVEERLRAHRLRLPWAEPGGPAADLAWVRSVVAVTGPGRQHRTWNLSAIWSIPTTEGTVWLKCVPPFFNHEAAVLELLTDRSTPDRLAGATPELLACDGHRMLLAEMPGRDGYDPDAVEQIAMVTALVEIQRTTIDRIDRFLARGVPDLRAGPLTEALTDLVDRVAAESKPLRRLLADLPRRFGAVDACGIPDALVHGDPHGGNCRRGTSPPMWFDWGDSFVGNPLLDVASLHRMAEPTVELWLRLWADSVPGSDPQRAWRELAPIAALRMAWVYQRFLDNIEPSERTYHRLDVSRIVAEVEDLLAAERRS